MSECLFGASQSPWPGNGCTQRTADEPGGTEPGMGERRTAEDNRCVEVALSGGAPWGFTLRGGQEHGEPLLITKIEEGSKAAVVGKLQVGDELVNINDVVLSGFRQEAICLVKGSHRTLKMVVRRRNEPVGRPHSWHSTKFTDNPRDPATMQLSSSGVCSSWHSRYHATSSSNNLSDPWDQTNLHRISHQFSSLGSMDSLDQPPAPYHPGRLSPGKSNNSMEHVTPPGKRDSAYSSFSTNSSTPDYSLCSSRSDNGSSTENVLSRLPVWEAGWLGAGRQGQAVPDQGSPAPEDRASPRSDDQPGSRPYRASLGPVWHVPEKRVTGDCRASKRASPPPPLPVRSDSYAVTKAHGDGGGQARQPGSARPQLRGGREVAASPYGCSGRRNLCLSPGPRDVSSPAPLDSGRPPDFGPGQALHSPRHQRQSSDEFSRRGVATRPGPPQPAAELIRMAPPACREDSPPSDSARQTRYFCLTSRPPHQAGAGLSRLRVESWDGHPPAPAPKPPRQQPEGSRSSRAIPPEEAAHRPARGILPEPSPSGLGAGDVPAARDLTGEPCWVGPVGDSICPEKTPILHLLTQESRRLQAEPGPVARQLKRADRFATALRNEIQTKRAQLQKSKSAATLTGSPGAGEAAGCCHGEALSDSLSPPDGSFSDAYKDGLKEAQARVLRATSFQRRDLGPLAPKDNPPPPLPGNPQAPGRAAGPHPLARVGGRKRLTQEQRLRSYSEPGKMNEVGGPEEADRPPQPGCPPPTTFADRRQFFEASVRPAQPSPAYGRPTPRPGPQPSLGESAQQKGWASSSEVEEVRRPDPKGRDRAASLGHSGWPECPEGGPNQAGGWSTAAHPGAVSNRGSGGREAEPRRLGTFAEYQATWREQRKLSEARNSGRYHSADNILDQSFQEPARPQYVHERSRSSPSRDFYLQDIPIEVRRRPEGFQKEMAHLATEAGAMAPRRRHQDSEGSENNAKGQQFPSETRLEQTWLEGNAQSSEHLPQERHGVPAGMLSGHCYPEAAEVQAGRKPEAENPESRPRGQDPSRDRVATEELENPTEADRKQGAQPRADEWRQQEPPRSGGDPAPQPGVVPPNQTWEGAAQVPTNGTNLLPSSVASAGSDPQETWMGGYPAEGSTHLGNGQGKADGAESPAFHRTPKPTSDAPRSPSPQFAPQRLTDKPPLTLEDDGLARIEKVTENNTTVKKVPIKIVRSESQTEKESRHNLLNNVDLVGFPSREQPKSIGSREHPYSLFAAYSRQEQGRLSETDQKASDSRADVEAPPVSDGPKAREKCVVDIKSEELVREIVVKDRSLADILYPNSKMKTTMDLMEGIFPKDETFLEEAQQRRKLPPRSHSPKATQEREEETIPIGVSLTTSSTYYSTSAPKAELLNKLKDMQEQMEEEEDSEDELNNDLTEKKQELIDSISKKLQVLREARESLQDDIQANNMLGDEVEVEVKTVCKPNEFDKFRMFIGDLDKVVNLLLSLSGRLARVENALNTLEESASPDERRTLTQKQKLLTRQHEDAKELKENLDRRERLVFDILSSYLTDELLQDYEHFVKMKSALTIEQRELEDKIKLGEEQLKCLLESLPLDCKPK